ncbi:MULTISPECIES: sulfurtransferase complex subunit TusB [unclassified Agarivorans]|uniref:sulfurtransferase complex subunit TusB n=1 Tax=unclassified Agarivorans TaxID=2636026 RepID=UPI0026E29CA8|nr:MULTISPECIES: sulfurtransferase complex subunit TusB [unclassified Agarivorans]MDO6687418.1 sulfurtransferase complex subunit TusB [Agarivorans sp. 3_MG-2023]MDO6715184.1 sulfurtransferase complex subunit TusB [Agarivorans sp. 2_MG-2023]
MLHILRHPYASEVFERCLSELDGSGHLVLIEDAVYAWLRSDPRLLQLEQQSRLSVLSADVSARGIEVCDKVLVDYQAMVQLSVTHHPALTW